MNQTDFEQEIQRFMQIRNEIRQEIDRIPSVCANLQESGKLLTSHFEVFRQIAKNTEDKMPAIIHAASHTMAKTVSDEASQFIKGALGEKITSFNQSVQNASHILNETKSSKYRKLFLFSLSGLLMSHLISFGGGYFYAKQNTYSLTTDFIKMYALGLSVKEASASLDSASPKKQAKEKSIPKK